MRQVTLTFDPGLWQLVPVTPTEEMLQAAAQDGQDLNGRPVWKHNIDVQNRWKWEQMLKAAPDTADKVAS